MPYQELETIVSILVHPYIICYVQALCERGQAYSYQHGTNPDSRMLAVNKLVMETSILTFPN